MGLSRSTFYDRPRATLQAGELLTRIGAICDKFECYGYRRVGAALRWPDMVLKLCATASHARSLAYRNSSDNR